jgi:arylsulfatase A-like enzyme
VSGRPNVVVFMPDQLRADALGCFGNALAHTPNVDALAARGTRFERAYGQHSVCSPSRVSMLTGWYPHVRGHRSLTHLLKPAEPNLLRLLKDAGYHVAHAGLRGDTFAAGVTKDSTSRFGFAVKPKSMFMRSPFPPEHRLARVYYHGRRPHDGVALDFDEACVRTAEAWLADGLPEPWLLYVPLVFPHPPFEVEEPWYSLHARSRMPRPLDAPLDDTPRYMRLLRERHGTDRLSSEDWAELAATYHGMVSRVDAQLGRVLAAVARTGAESRTLAIFTTDHGEYLGDFGLVEKWPSGQHESLLRNPLVIAGPGVRAGNVAASFVELVDLLPTLLELAEAPARHTHYGKSLWPLLRDGAAAHRDAAFSEGGFAAREAELLERAPFPYDLKSQLQHDDPECVGRVVSVRTREHTYVHRLYERPELYDRARDPGERVNLAGRAELAQVEAALRGRVLDWLLDTADVIPWEADSRFDAEGAL